MLCKSNKDDYTKTKYYYLAVLLNILGKVLKAILAKHLSYLAIEHILYFFTNIDRHKSTFTNHKYYYLFNQGYAIWNVEKIAFLLLLNIARTFDNIN